MATPMLEELVSAAQRALALGKRITQADKAQERNAAESSAHQYGLAVVGHMPPV